MKHDTYWMGSHLLTSPLMNAAGTCKTVEAVKDLAKVQDIGAILLGSVTLLPRDGNSDTTYFSTPYGSINSVGMQNFGMDAYEKHIPDMVSIAHGVDKKFGVSVAGVTGPEEFVILSERACAAGADFIELNIGCPNVRDRGSKHQILTFNLNGIQQMLTLLEKRLDRNMFVSVKISPISDPLYIEELAKMIGEFELIKAVTAINTFPNGHALTEAREQVITNGKGLGGIAGPALGMIGKGQVLQYSMHLPSRMQIIAAGGISTGRDVLDYETNGAGLFQIGTAFLDKGPSVFGQILFEAMELNAANN